MKRIVSVVLISALLLTGCRQTPENSADSKLYVSINGENLQGIKEVAQKKNVDLENMDIKARGVEKRALEAAIFADAMDVEMLQMLVDAGAEVNIKDDNYLCEIILNADIPYSRNVEESLKILLKKGADPNRKDVDGYTAVDRWICKNGIDMLWGTVTSTQNVWKMVEYFQKYGGEITKDTLRFYLKNGGYVLGKELIHRLEKEGKETGLPEDLLYTINGDNQKLLSYLEKNDPSSKQVLLQAVAHCNVDVWKKLKEKGCDLAIKGPDKRTLLHIAASYNDADIVKFLAKKEDLKKKTEEQM